MKNYIDLHTHSTASDGTMAPSELVEKACEIGLKAIALTDHDTFAGLKSARNRAEELDLELVNGIELSCDYIKGEIHILAYWFDKNPLHDEELMKNVAILQEIRVQRNVKLFNKLHEVGVNIAEEDVIAEMKGERIMARPHFARAMMKKGYVPDVQSAFDKYLAEDGLAYVPKDTITPETAIEILLKANAFVSLAHPFLIRCKTEEERKTLISNLKDCGLHGIEAYYSLNSEEDTKLSLQYAKEFGLVPTGGSDYHGTNKPHIALGKGTGNLAVEYSVFENMKNFYFKV